MFVDGSLSNLLKCTSCNNGSASFIVPTERFDSRYKRTIQGKQVAVYVNGSYVFNGFLDTTNAELSPDSDGFTVDAKSVLEKLSTVWIGQYQNKNVVTYRIADEWQLDDILRDIFDQLGGVHANLLKLGNTSVIAGKNYDFGKEDLVFRNINYASAIDQILAYAGNVVYRPRYTLSGVYLDLYQTAGNNNGTSFCKVSDYDDDSIYANVQSISAGDSVSDTIDQVTVFGSPKRAIITVFGNADIGVHPVQLIKDWDSSLEARVRANPETAKRDAPGYVAGSEHVDRRFKLPACLHNLLKLKDLPIDKDAEGKQQYKLQAFQWKSTLATDNEAIIAYGIVDTAPTLVDADFDLDNNYITFKEPATNLMQVELFTEPETDPENPPAIEPTATSTAQQRLPKKTYAPASVGVTIGIEMDQPLMYRTPARQDVPQNENILREDYTYVQYTSKDLQIDDDGTEFGTVVIFTEDVSPPIVNVATDKLVIKDDTSKIKSLAYEILKEKNVHAKTLDITIPFVTNHYKIGNRLNISGLYDPVINSDEFSITNVQYDLESYRINITADNSKPLKYSEG